MDKPKKGNCGTCHWWEYQGVVKLPDGDELRNGLCMVNPPIPVMVATHEPGSALRPGGPRVVPGVQSMVPPQNERGRCEKWRKAGMLPEAAMEASSVN